MVLGNYQVVFFFFFSFPIIYNCLNIYIFLKNIWIFNKRGIRNLHKWQIFFLHSFDSKQWKVIFFFFPISIQMSTSKWCSKNFWKTILRFFFLKKKWTGLACYFCNALLEDFINPWSTCLYIKYRLCTHSILENTIYYERKW